MELIPFDINADFEKWDIVTRAGTKIIEFHLFKHAKCDYPFMALSICVRRYPSRNGMS